MDDYNLVDSAVDNIVNYMEALDVEEDDLTITLRPVFDEEGRARSIQYGLEAFEEGVDIEHDFRMGRRFRELGEDDISAEYDYSNWVEKFAQSFPNTNLNYRPAHTTRPEIEDAVDTVQNFLRMARADETEIGMLFDPQYNTNSQTWSMEYHIRPLPSEEDTSAGMDWAMDFEDKSPEEFENEIYPLWINKFKEEFQADLTYPDPEELTDLKEY